MTNFFIAFSAFLIFICACVIYGFYVVQMKEAAFPASPRLIGVSVRLQSRTLHGRQIDVTQR